MHWPETAEISAKLRYNDVFATCRAQHVLLLCLLATTRYPVPKEYATHG